MEFWSNINWRRKAALICFLLAKMTTLFTAFAVFHKREAVVPLLVMCSTLLVASVVLCCLKVPTSEKEAHDNPSS